MPVTQLPGVKMSRRMRLMKLMVAQGILERDDIRVEKVMDYLAGNFNLMTLKNELNCGMTKRVFIDTHTLVGFTKPEAALMYNCVVEY